jgi:hypothetical protein
MRYYLNKLAQPNGDHEVHQATCLFIPNKENRIDLGEFNSCIEAIVKAQTLFTKSNGCFFCAKLCHES